MKKIQIITLTYNKLEITTKLFIESLYQYTPVDLFDLIIIDNNSTDGTVEYLKSIENKYDNLKIIYNSENLGYSKGNNIGLANIDTNIPYIGLLNNDILFTPNWLEKSLEVMDNNQNVALASPRTNRNKFVKMTQDNYLENYKKYISKYQTTDFCEDITAYFCCAIYRTAAFLEVGNFDEAYTPAFWEDVDLIFRNLYAGYRVGHINSAFVFHNHSSTSKSVPSEIFKRNEDYFKKKHPLGKWVMEHKRTNVIKDVIRYIKDSF